jgi:hypothetical protein
MNPKQLKYETGKHRLPRLVTETEQIRVELDSGRVGCKLCGNVVYGR